MLVTSIIATVIGLLLLGLIVLPIVYLSELIYQWMNSKQ
jgi:hypothetical protein